MEASGSKHDYQYACLACKHVLNSCLCRISFVLQTQCIDVLLKSLASSNVSNDRIPVKSYRVTNVATVMSVYA